MTAAVVVCPECGEPLVVVLETRRLQPVGGPLTVNLRLGDESLAHIEAHG